MQLLTVSNFKTLKGASRGYLTAIIHLAPAEVSGHNVCPYSTPGCRAACLNTAGRGTYDNVQQARIRRTKLFFDNPEAFYHIASEEIYTLQRKAEREGAKLAIRPNGTSDIPKLAHTLASRFPEVQFYDYTKIPEPWKRERPNYHLTFSQSEANLDACKDALAHGVNVATVFKVAPTIWFNHGVVSGDEDDLRFIDVRPCVISLTPKGRAKKDTTGFVR